MKKLLLMVLMIVFISTLNLYAQEGDSLPAVPDTIVWYLDFDQAQQVAGAEGRYMLIEFYTDW